ncbi:MAG: hypothetical protein Q7T82_16945 [Armatimonadota bacterium]|nr:hypothetical protein [Armatimonadota bacterium]
MPRAFSQSTAEQMVAAVNAVIAARSPRTVDFVVQFSDMSKNQAEQALSLAVDMGMLAQDVDEYLPESPLCRFLATPDERQKAAVVRVALESYEPFTVFRMRLAATGDTSTAAQETIAILQLVGHKEDVKNTLLSLGTFSQALTVLTGGKYQMGTDALNNDLDVLAQACTDRFAAENRIRLQLEPDAAGLVSVDSVLVPLAHALLYAIQEGGARSAVVHAGNAVDSYLSELANRLGATLAGTGINQKLNDLRGQKQLPTKLLNVGYYLGHVRNAADHGTDTDVNAAWNVRRSTGLEYVYVACSFIAAVTTWEKGKPAEV